MTTANAVMLQIGRYTTEARKEVTESASERLEHLKERREHFNQRIDRGEVEVVNLERELRREKGSDAHEIQDDVERTSAGIQRDEAKRDLVIQQEQAQFDAVLKQEQVTTDAFRSVAEMGDRTFEVLRSLA